MVKLLEDLVLPALQIVHGRHILVLLHLPHFCLESDDVVDFILPERTVDFYQEKLRGLVAALYWDVLDLGFA